MNRILTTLIVLVLVSIATLNGQTVNKNLIDGEIYVKYHDNFPVDFSIEFAEPHTLPGLTPELIAQYGIVQARFSFNKTTSIQLQKTVRIKFTAIDKAEELINYFAKQSFVEYAEGVPAAYPTHTPNDLGANSVNNAWHLYKINALKAWDLNKGNSNIRVAVVDHEFDINHPDLKGNVWKNPGEIPNNGKDDDNNGYVDDVSGWDMADNDNNVICNTNTFLDHGTPCAGLVAATTNNGIGVSSIGYNISFIPLKASKNNQNSSVLSYTSEGIVYAGLMKADVISCSFGSTSFSTTAENAINYSVSQGCFIIAASGNYSNSINTYPASYNNVIAVASTDINDVKASSSNYGTWIDISAPGVNIKTTDQNNNYKIFSGTSAACPVSAGLVGLMKSYYPKISNNDLEKCLLNSVDNINGQNSSYIGKLGSGRINAEKSLKCIDSVRTSPPTIKVEKSKSIVCPKEPVTLTVSELNKKTIDSVVWYLPGSISTSKNNLDVVVTYLNDGYYNVSAVVHTVFGKDSVFFKDFITINHSKSLISVTKDNLEICPKDPVKLTVTKLSNNIVDSVVWHLSGSTSIIVNDSAVLAYYLYDGKYNVSAVGYSNFCSDSVYLKDFIVVSRQQSLITVGKDVSEICPNDPVMFTLSKLNNKTIDSVVWHLPGSFHSSISDTGALVRYYNDSTFDISVVAYSNLCVDSLYLSSFIRVNTNINKTIFSENFNDTSTFKKYKINNPDNKNSWGLQNVSFKDEALKMNFFEYISQGAYDEFIFPPIDLSLVKKPKLTFDHAFVFANYSLTNDSFLVYASIDSGKTFRYNLLGLSAGSLRTTTSKTTAFKPATKNDWCHGISNNCVTIPLDSLAGHKNVVLKFVSYDDAGNNLYIDNVEIFATCGDIYTYKPVNNFSASSSITCEKTQVHFTNKTGFSPKTFQWHFPGGTPDTSSQQNPVIKYNTPGTYDVTLITSNPLGADTLTKKDYMRVVAFPKVVVDSLTRFCAGDSLYITASGADSITWYKPNYKLWYPGATLADKPIQSLTYSVKVITKEGCADSVTAKGVLVPLPPAVTLVKQGNNLAAQHSPGAYKYAWYVNDTLLAGITTQSFTPSKTGNYKVIISDFGCTSTSQYLFFQFVQKPDAVNEYWVNKVSLYPNPASKQLFIGGLDETQPTTVTITDMPGRRVMEMVLDTNQLDITALTPGVYFVTLGQNGKYAVKKLLVE